MEYAIQRQRLMQYQMQKAQENAAAIEMEKHNPGELDKQIEESRKRDEDERREQLDNMNEFAIRLAQYQMDKLASQRLYNPSDELPAGYDMEKVSFVEDEHVRNALVDYYVSKGYSVEGATAKTDLKLELIDKEYRMNEGSGLVRITDPDFTAAMKRYDGMEVSEEVETLQPENMDEANAYAESRGYDELESFVDVPDATSDDTKDEFEFSDDMLSVEERDTIYGTHVADTLKALEEADAFFDAEDAKDDVSVSEPVKRRAVPDAVMQMADDYDNDFLAARGVPNAIGSITDGDGSGSFGFNE